MGSKLAAELAGDFIKVRQDHATGTLERASPGKFVETFVQCLQQVATGKFDEKPDVDAFLNQKLESLSALSDGLRLCAGRIARAIYTLRNKRNIAHKNPVDPNTFDLAFIHQGAAWIMAELLRNATGVTMQEAGVLIEQVQTPVGTLVEEIDGTHLVHGDLSVRGELLVLLHSRHPVPVRTDNLTRSMSNRSPGTIKNRLGELKVSKLVHGDHKGGFRLTRVGYEAALQEIRGTQS